MAIKELTRIPKPDRSSFGHVLAGDWLFIIGGHPGQFHYYGAANFAAEMHVYDATANRWTQLKPFPRPSQGFRAIARGDFIYAFGGFTPDPRLPANPWPAASSDNIYRYSMKADQWEVIGIMPRRRSSYVCGVLGNKAYLIGGWDATPARLGDTRGRFVRPIDVFDLGSEVFLPSCLEFPILPVRRALSSTVWKGRIVIAGGLGEQGFMSSDLYAEVAAWLPPANECEPDPDPKKKGQFLQGDWSLLPYLPMPLFSPGIGCVGDNLFVAGGVRPLLSPYNGGTSTTILRLDSGAKAWVEIDSMKEARSFVEVVGQRDGSVLLVGGHRGYETDGLPSDLVEVLA